MCRDAVSKRTSDLSAEADGHSQPQRRDHPDLQRCLRPRQGEGFGILHQLGVVEMWPQPVLLTFCHLTLLFPRPGTALPSVSLGVGQKRKRNPQALKFSAILSSYFVSPKPCLLPVTPTASHGQPNLEYGKQEKQQHLEVPSF